MNCTSIEAGPSKSPFSFLSLKRDKQSRSARISKHTERHVLYWPYHLLHEDFPRARILTWGYNSVVSSFFHGSANKNHLFAHSRDFLLDLKGKRQACVRDQSFRPTLLLQILKADVVKLSHVVRWSSWHILLEVCQVMRSSIIHD